MYPLSERAVIALAGICAGSNALGCNSILDIEPAQLSSSAGASDVGAPSSAAPPAFPSLAPGAPEARGSAAVGASSNDGVLSASDVAGVAPEAMAASHGPVAAPETAMDSAEMASRDAGVADPLTPTAPAPPGPAIGPDGLAVPLPNDLIDAPVSGEIVFSQDAQWEVNGVFQPTFEVRTPTASYWIVKPLGTMVSLEDAFSGGAQWIAFSSGFRPLRGVPALETPPAAVSTELDRNSQTPTHLRLIATSADTAWHWVWDFYLTHVTFTIDRAPVPIGFSYRGVPAGALGAEDRLIRSDGTEQSARNSFDSDLPGPVEWVYIADTTARHSLFLMQHGDDALPEQYQVRDNDSAAWVFGSGQISALPLRFSLGLIADVTPAVVGARVAYVASVIH